MITICKTCADNFERYLRYEVQSRMAVFYTAASLSGAFSGLLAYGIEKMQGIDGLGGWQWYVCVVSQRFSRLTKLQDLHP